MQLEENAASHTANRPYELDVGVRAEIGEAIRRARAEILELSHRIHANPEPAYEEHQASAWVAAALVKAGYSVERPAGRLKTAIKARIQGGLGTNGPRIGLIAEYDALPGLGHGCAHNVIAAICVGAAIGLAEIRDRFGGEIIVLGTPAEEYGSGKQVMIDDGLFEDVDVALMVHPRDRTTVECELLALEDVEVEYVGAAAHAAAEPWRGLNALDALVVLLTSIGLWRQQLPTHARVHGIVVEGGTAANVIPDRSRARFMIRSADEQHFEDMRARFSDIAHAAALATGCDVRVSFSGRSRTMRDNTTLRAVFESALSSLSIARRPIEAGQVFSSDIGNVSWVVPTIHPSIAICDPGTPIHSIAFRDAAATAAADDATIVAATAVAYAAYALLETPDIVKRAKDELRLARQG